jgi:hypothetical protein
MRLAERATESLLSVRPPSPRSVPRTGDERRSFLADDPSGMTAAAPSPSEGRRPLGEVLVERGIVTPEQLTTALEQQRATGRQLGEIIVALGFAPGPIVAQALATQHGGLIKTEYGFATPWSKSNAPAPVAAVVPTVGSELAERNRTIADLRAWAEKAQAAIKSRDDAIARLRAELTGQGGSATEPVADAAHEEALDALRAELAAELERHRSTQAQLEDRTAEVARLEAALTTAADATDEHGLETLRAELEAESARHASTQARFEEREADLARLEAALADLRDSSARHEGELASAKESQTSSEYELAAARRTIDELERRLQNAGTRAETLARRVAEQDEELGAFRSPTAAEPNRWGSAPMHYVLQRSTDGYDLVAHDGPPPAVGEMVDGLRVARVAPAGPGFDVPCAHLAD